MVLTIAGTWYPLLNEVSSCPFDFCQHGTQICVLIFSHSLCLLCDYFWHCVCCLACSVSDAGLAVICRTLAGLAAGTSNSLPYHCRRSLCFVLIQCDIRQVLFTATMLPCFTTHFFAWLTFYVFSSSLCTLLIIFCNGIILRIHFLLFTLEILIFSGFWLCLCVFRLRCFFFHTTYMDFMMPPL